MPQAAPIPTSPSSGATSAPRPSLPNESTNENSSDTGATTQPSAAASQNGAPQAKKSREPRISDIGATKMIATGVLFDLIALIPIVGGYSAEIIGGMTFFLWFLILGLPLMSPKTLANWALNLIVGETATAGVWPGFTIGAILTVIMTRTEDKTGLDVMSLAKGDVKSLGEVGKNLSGQIQSRVTGGSAPSGSTQPTNTPTAAPKNEKNPVTASQEEHFADPSTPVAQGATPASPSAKKAPPVQRRQTNPQDEEIVTGLRPSQEDTSFTPDPYQEDPYALESGSQPRGIDSLPRRQGTPSEPRVPFPGTSPQFGRGSRQGNKILDFDVRRKEVSPETTEDATPTGATPIPKPVNDDVS